MAQLEAKPRRLQNTEELRHIEAPPPFLNELLQAYPSAHIDETIFQGISKQASEYNLQLQLDQMNGEIDRTRLVSEFIGRCHSSDEVQAELDIIAYTELDKLREKPQLREEVLSTLAKKTCTIDALLWLDEEHGILTQNLKSIRHPEANAFRERNIKAIEKAQWLAEKPDITISFFHIPTPQYLKPKPEVILIPTYAQNKLIAVKRRICVPHLPSENSATLQHLTPMGVQRELSSGEQDPSTSAGFMSHFRKAGDPLVRATAQVIRSILKKDEDNQIRMNLDDELRDFFASH